MRFAERIASRLKRELNIARHQWIGRKFRRSIRSDSNKDSRQTVLFFNASTRLSGLSQNAGFSLVTSLALELAGARIIHLVCKRGMSHCVLGTNNNFPETPPPCAECMRTSRKIFQGAEVRELRFTTDSRVETAISDLSLEALLKFEDGEFSVGKLVLPSLRWILRKHHLADDRDTRYLAREYILSAVNLKRQFEEILEDIRPTAVVVFNGMFYPEATLRWAAQSRGIPVYSHEVGMLPLSAFFTDQEATAYPVAVDDSFQLTESRDRVLDEYLNNRTQGKFITAGIQFWPEMKGLDEKFWEKAGKYASIVPVFTNVIFDTSQSHANVVFDHMFQWLDGVLEAIRKNPEILFVVRAHPDELRPGKESCETVADWVTGNQVDQLPNLVFVRSDQYISSYELVRHAKFVMVYNSTIGLEASIMSRPVLCAGKARYTQISTVFFPPSREEYFQLLDKFLKEENIENPEEFRLNARRVLYSQLFRASLPFNDFLEEDGVWRGYVRLKNFPLDMLTPEKSPLIKVLVEGILQNKPLIREI